MTPEQLNEARAVAERLRAKRRHREFESGGGTIDATGKATSWTHGEVWLHVNPDGPAAAAVIEQLVATILQEHPNG